MELLGVVPQLAYGQVVRSTQNPEQIAILHWYAANLTAAFGVGDSPALVAFDRANIWVANELSNRNDDRFRSATVIGFKQE